MTATPPSWNNLPLGTDTYAARCRQAQHLWHEADAILLGGGAGLSAAAGIHYAGPDFERAFAPYIKRYRFTDLYSSSFYPFHTEEERWAYWAHHIDYARLAPEGRPLYRQLRRAVGQKPHFVITTNVDGQFVKAGFEEDKVFAVQGDYAQLQCARACHDGLYDATPLVAAMLQEEHDCRVPKERVPQCSVCGGQMDIHIRKDSYFVEDEAWHQHAKRYEEFLAQWGGKKLLLVELGVGFNTPSIIRFPFERMAAAWPHAALVRVNRDFPHVQVSGIAQRVLFTEDMGPLLAQWLPDKAPQAPAGEQ